MRVLLPTLLVVLAIGCADRPNGEPSGETASAVSADSQNTEARQNTAARRARLDRLRTLDALARLYVGHDLRRDELLALEGRSERDILDALSARPDFREQYATRLGTFGGASSVTADPRAPIADELGAETASRFARWLVRTLAPAAAEEVLAKNEATLAQMTYLELLDAVRTAARRAS